MPLHRKYSNNLPYTAMVTLASGSGTSKGPTRKGIAIPVLSEAMTKPHAITRSLVGNQFTVGGPVYCRGTSVGEGRLGIPCQGILISNASKVNFHRLRKKI